MTLNNLTKSPTSRISNVDKIHNTIIVFSGVVSDLVDEILERQKNDICFFTDLSEVTDKANVIWEHKSSYHLMMSIMALRHEIENLHRLFFRYSSINLKINEKPGPLIDHCKRGAKERLK